MSAIAVFSGSAYKRMLEGKPTYFIAGTMIMTAAGLMAIERIKAGDLVLATSPDTYETTYKKVVETYVRETKNLIHLLIRDGNHTEKLVTTDTHPFYVSGKGFIPAAELCVGDELCTAREAQAVKSQGTGMATGIIEKILLEAAGKPVKVYNFQVEDLHTYHVGLFGVWVHNADYGQSKKSEDGIVEKGNNKIDIKDLPVNVQDSFNEYDKSGWRGNISGQTQGTNAGRTWRNSNLQLPEVDSNGNPITYREFDVNSFNGIARDGERFIVGSDGSVWYTDSHYGEGASLNGIPDFVQIK